MIIGFYFAAEVIRSHAVDDESYFVLCDTMIQR